MNAMKRFIFFICVGAIAHNTLSAQSTPSVTARWGLHLGGNYNIAGVGFGNWAKDPNRNAAQFSELVYNDGSGAGLYGGINMQVALSNRFHLGTRISYDNRSSIANDEKSFPKPSGILTSATGQYYNDKYTFHTDYLTMEPFFKVYFGSHFHLTGGVSVGLALTKTFDYAPEGGTRQTDLDFAQTDSIKHKITGSGFAGVGYDIFLSDPSTSNQWILTPYIESSYMISQRGVDFTNQHAFNDALSTASLRAGVSLTFGLADIAERVEAPAASEPIKMVEPPSTELFGLVEPIDGVYAKRIERAEFPLRPFVFFDQGSTDIPSRYK
ncbi:MAG: PorT family protein [Ignavibacteria bacterium]|nr:PorT family protein [Ignavibacteria bacterium]